MLRRTFFCWFLLLHLIICAAAEIPCQCGLEECSCFIQLGDEGPAVDYIQNALTALGYLAASNDASDFDDHTLQAVRQFQKDHQLIPAV